MGRTIPLTNNRKNVYFFLTRAKRYHASVTGTYEIDATPLMSAIGEARARGESVSINACLVKATALVLEKFPALNQHFFHGLLGRFIYEFDGIHCGLLVARQTDAGEDIVLPAVIRNANTLSLADIEIAIQHYKTKPLTELPEFQATDRLKNLPTFAREIIAFLARTSPKAHEKLFGGTYALSCVAGLSHARFLSTATVSPTASAFVPGTIADKAWVVDGVIQIRKILPMTLVADHYVFDGLEGMRAMQYLGELLTTPSALGLRAPAARMASNESTRAASA